MGKIIAYCREGCFYSANTSSVLTDLKKLILNNSNSNLSIEIHIVPNNEMEKNIIKTKLNSLIGSYSTFPIIIYESSKGKQFFIGGNSALEEIMNFVNSFNQINVNNFSSCMSNNTLAQYDEGKRRLICNLLVLKNKIVL
jgi:hypothetical protein